MKHYVFKGDKEFVEVKLQDDNKLMVKNRRTNYKYAEIEEKLFGNDREKRNKCRLLISRLPKLTYKEIDIYLVLEFHKMGYVLVEKNGNKLFATNG